MASHQLAIAKASFSAGLLRPNPTSVSRDEITAFHSALDQALSHCSYANIQNCKSWLLNYVVSSSNRVGVWAKYLVALSGSLATDDGKPSKTSNKRKRLHILYLLNDLFHHTKYHLDSTAAFSTLTGSCQPYIVELLDYAASYDREKCPKHHRRLDDLLDIWAENGYYGADYVNKLREVVKNSAVSGPVKTSIGVEENNTHTANQKLSGKEVPFVMPSTHGDPTTPYYDLPAGNLVPHIIPNSTVPLRPDSIKPLQFLAGPADEKLVTALKVFMKEVDQIYELEKPAPKDDDEVVDIDELGQTVIRDATTGEIINGETYYGWSRSFCEQMKKRNTKDTRRSRSRSRSWSRSLSRSQTPPKRRRYSDSPESNDGRRRRRSPGSESRSPVGRRGGLGNGRSYSRSASPAARRQSRPRERSYSLSPPIGPRSSFPPPFKRKQFPSAAPPPPPPMHQHGFPPGGQFPAPGMPLPAPPPNYQGAWPPPPPPMPGVPGMMPNPAFPSPFPLQGGGHFPPVHMGGGAPGAPVPLPPGSYHFPPPHSGAGSNPGYQNQQGWGQQGGAAGRGGGHGWR
ncbi:hypothetical protein SI65_03960 [Aspergillus cristatus]|uniref:CID domain-containing protein n=1 Tax=Aspergillus cristatus TaxID=573508 RepID=A0A1E3BJ30_ASPCR|nr:hypothetical protein SI65_03960 [Aspergillus cristatus]